jgi:hypothetical protein
MEAYFYANNTAQIFSSVATPGYRLIGELELPPGSYVVTAKADIGTNATSGSYPPPAWPYTGGGVGLRLGGATDTALVAVKPESGDNLETITLMVATEISRTQHARMYMLNPYPLNVVVNSVRISAIQVDKVHVFQVGSDQSNLPEEVSLFVEASMSLGKYVRLFGLPEDKH